MLPEPGVVVLHFHFDIFVHSVHSMHYITSIACLIVLQFKHFFSPRPNTAMAAMGSRGDIYKANQTLIGERSNPEIKKFTIRKKEEKITAL